MSQKDPFSTKAYTKLLQEINQLLQRWDKLQNARDPKQDLQALWKVGQKIETSEFARTARSELLSKVSRDLQRDRTQLFRFQQFFQLYPQGVEQVPGHQVLTWSHYQETLALDNPDEREFYLNEALRENWPSRRIRTAVRSKLYQHYHLSRSKKHPNGTLPRIVTHFYVYRARVEDIVDPDTVRLFADQGFDGWQHLIGRLRGLNAPELHGPQSELAVAGAAFVKKSLAGLKHIVVQSHKCEREKFGRYLVDIFFHPLWEDADKIYLEGFFLNQMLLDRGFAKLAVY